MLPRSILEFVALVTGLLMTFYIEDRNELEQRLESSRKRLPKFIGRLAPNDLALG